MRALRSTWTSGMSQSAFFAALVLFFVPAIPALMLAGNANIACNADMGGSAVLPGDFAGIVYATNGTAPYKYAGDKANGNFRVDPKTGAVTINNILARGVYVLSVTATEKAGRNTTKAIRIAVCTDDGPGSVGIDLTGNGGDGRVLGKKR